MIRLSADQTRARMRQITRTGGLMALLRRNATTIMAATMASILGVVVISMGYGIWRVQKAVDARIAADAALKADNPMAYATAADGVTIITHTHKGEAPKTIARMTYKEGCPELQIDGAAYQKMLNQDRTGQDRLESLARQFKDAAGCRPIVKRSGGVGIGINLGSGQVGPMIGL